MIEINFINILGTAVLAVMFVFWYTPIDKPKRFILRYSPHLIQEVFSCTKCTSFVFGLILLQNIFAAALCAFFGFVIGWIIDYITAYYE